MKGIIVEIMAEILSVLSLATKLIQQGRVCKYAGAYSSLVAQCVIAMFVKKSAGEKDVEAALQRLDRLTQDEAWEVNARTPDLVHRLESNLRSGEAMEGAWCSFR
jgi:hypothetical protein